MVTFEIINIANPLYPVVSSGETDLIYLNALQTQLTQTEMMLIINPNPEKESIDEIL